MPRLHDYQEEAVAWIKAKKRGALFLDMGLGKTAITLSSLSAEDLPVLVIAHKRVTEETWPEEIPIWRPDLTFALASGSAAERRAALSSGADIVAISRDNISPRKGKTPWSGLTLDDSETFNTIVLDELSSFKSYRSERWKSLKRFLQPNHRVIGLTGTPAPNGLLDLWAQVYLLDAGQRLGKSITAYRARYFLPGRQLPTGVITEWHLRPGAEARIHSLLEDIALSMGTEGRVQLPPLSVNQVAVTMPPAAQKVYTRLKNTLVADLEALGVGGVVHTASNAAVLSNKLSQVTAGFIYHDVEDDPDASGLYDQIHTAKIDAVKEIVEGAVGQPVLVFYRFKAELDALRAAFPEASLASEQGFVKRWNAGQIPVLLAHPASAGHGLNLQKGGHIAVWTTPTWSLEEDLQANKRLFRQGQDHPVQIHYIVVRGTVDEAILARLRDKVSVQDALTSHLELNNR